MQNIIIAPQQRNSLIQKMKREVKPSRRLRMHIALLAADGRSPTEISRTLFCSRTTVYTIASRFLREGHSAFDDIRRRGPRTFAGAGGQRRREASRRGLAHRHGWLRSRWSCKLLALQFSGASRHG